MTITKQPPRHRRPGLFTRAIEWLYDFGARRRGEQITEHRPDPVLAEAQAQLARNQAFIDALPKFTEADVARAVETLRARLRDGAR